MPTRDSRLGLLDFVRGVAIIGTLSVNYGLFSEKATDDFDSFDLANLIGNVLANGKFLCLLAIVFGVGLAIQYDRATRAGRQWIAPYLWRNLLLVGDGFLHFALVFYYDILMAYGLAAMLVALVMCRDNVVVRRWSYVALGAHILVIGAYSLSVSLMSKAEARIQMLENAMWSNSFAMAPYLDQVTNRIQNVVTLRFETILVQPTFAYLMLLGVRLWRDGFFTHSPEARKAHRRLAMWGLLAGMPTLAVWFVPLEGMGNWGRYFFSPLLAVGYLGLLASLYDARFGNPATRFFSDIGRMALSCYVLQTILCSVLFFGWGFGLRGKLEPGLDVFVFLVLVGVQGLFAHLWLQRYPTGPFEMVWRRMAAWVR